MEGCILGLVSVLAEGDSDLCPFSFSSKRFEAFQRVRSLLAVLELLDGSFSE